MGLSPQFIASQRVTHSRITVEREPKWAATCARFILRMTEVLDVMTVGGS